MPYCYRHSIDSPSDVECPVCRAEQVAEEQHEIAGLLRQINRGGGDFPCPHCRLISLKEDASRCPKCHGDIGADYWIAVRQFYGDAIRQKSEQEERERPERERREKQWKIRRAAERRRKFVRAVYWSYLFPSLTILGTNVALSLTGHGMWWTAKIVGCLTPVANWFYFIGFVGMWFMDHGVVGMFGPVAFATVGVLLPKLMFPDQPDR